MIDKWNLPVYLLIDDHYCVTLANFQDREIFRPSSKLLYAVCGVQESGVSIKFLIYSTCASSL